MDDSIRKDLEIGAIKVVLIEILNDLANANSSTSAEAREFLQDLRSRCLHVVGTADISARRTPETNAQLREQLKDEVDKIFNSITYSD